MGTVFSGPNVFASASSASSAASTAQLATGAAACASLQGKFWECGVASLWNKDDPGLLTPDALPDGSASGMWAYLQQNNRLFSGAVVGLILLVAVAFLFAAVGALQKVRDSPGVTYDLDDFTKAVGNPEAP